MAESLQFWVSCPEATLEVGLGGGPAIRVRSRFPRGCPVAGAGMDAVLSALGEVVYLFLELPPGRSQSVLHVPACPCAEVRAVRDSAVPITPHPCRRGPRFVALAVAFIAELSEAAHIDPVRSILSERSVPWSCPYPGGPGVRGSGSQPPSWAPDHPLAMLAGWSSGSPRRMPRMTACRTHLT
jgi:hypothetical protein